MEGRDVAIGNINFTPQTTAAIKVKLQNMPTRAEKAAAEEAKPKTVSASTARVQVFEGGKKGK